MAGEATSKKRAAIYARTATTQELGANFAMQEQIRQGLEYASRQGYEIVDGLIYEEVGSGTSNDRPGLTALQEAAKQGKYDILIVASFDRISRRQDQSAIFFSAMEAYGVRIESVLESFAEISLEVFAKDIYTFVEQVQREMLAKRRQQGRKAKQEKTNVPPYGYAANLDRSGFDPNAQEADRLRHVFMHVAEE